MADVWKIAVTCFTAVGIAVGAFMGEMNGFLIALLIVMGLDVITGIIVATINHEVSSKVSFKGLAKKVFIILMVGFANCLDILVFETPGVFRTAVIFFYLANEGISVIENMSRTGLPIPKQIKDALAVITKKAGGEEDETE